MLIKKHKLNGKKPEPQAQHTAQQANMAEPELNFEAPAQVEAPMPELSFEDEEFVKQRVEEMIAEQKQRLEAQEEELKAQMQAQAEQVLADANTQAQSILAEAQNKEAEVASMIQAEQAKLQEEQAQLAQAVEAEKKKAFDEGFQEGQVLVSELKNILGNFQNAKQQVLAEAHSEILTLAMDVAKQILKKEVTLNPDILEAQVASSIAKVVKGKGKVQVFVNPSELEFIEDLRPNLEETLDSNIQLIFSADENVEQGSCIVETKGGRFDASFSTQLKVIKEAFKEYVNEEIVELEDEEPEPKAKKKATTKKKTTSKSKTKKTNSTKEKKADTKKVGKTTQKTAKKAKKTDISEADSGNKSEENKGDEAEPSQSSSLKGNVENMPGFKDEPSLEEMQALEGNMDELFTDMEDISEGALDDLLSEALATEPEEPVNQDMPISDENMPAVEEESSEDSEESFEDDLETEMLEDEHFVEDESEEDSDTAEEESMAYADSDPDAAMFDTVSEEDFDESVDERFPDY